MRRVMLRDISMSFSSYLENISSTTSRVVMARFIYHGYGFESSFLSQFIDLATCHENPK